MYVLLMKHGAKTIEIKDYQKMKQERKEEKELQKCCVRSHVRLKDLPHLFHGTAGPFLRMRVGISLPYPHRSLPQLPREFLGCNITECKSNPVTQCCHRLFTCRHRRGAS